MGDTTHNPSALLDVNYRERTFSTRPPNFNAQLEPRELAEAGFVHSAEQDVKCSTCGFVLNSGLFNNLSDVLNFHSEMRPDCERSNHSASVGQCSGNALDASSRGHFGSSSSSARQCNGDTVDVGNRAPSKLPSSAVTEPLSSGIAANSASGSRETPSTTVPTRNVECKGFHTFDSLRYERERLSTFIDWPVSWLSPEALAKEAFYYLRDNDFVSCVFCRGIVGAWEPGDIPSQEHKRHFPKCAFVRGQPVGNVPIAQGDLLASLPAVGPCEPATAAASALPAFDCKLHTKGKQCSVQCKKDSIPGREASSDPLDDLPEYSGPKRKDFLTKDSREKSYKNWPKKVKQTPEGLAEAGFFYCGLSDHVRCFHCGNGLRNWEADDNPWVEHARWYPQCNFVLLQKGLEFIDQVRRVNPPYFRHHQSPLSDHSSSKAASTSPPPSGAPFVSQTYTSDVNSNYRVRITESQLDLLMDLDIVKSVLAMGFSPRAVRKALRHKIEETGVPFFNLETCIEKVLTCVEQMESEVEAEKKQGAKLSAYQREREERIRHSHEQSLLRAASASSFEGSEDAGMDVVNTERRSPPRTERNRATAEDSSPRRTADSLRLSCPGQCPRTPIITSPVMPARRESNLLRSPPHQERVASSPNTSSPSAGSIALSSNINMQRSMTFRPVAGDHESLDRRGNSALRNMNSNNSGSSSSEENVMESEDIIEYPLTRRLRNDGGDEEAPMDATSSPIGGHHDTSLELDRDITPTNDDFHTTSTPRASPSGGRMFASCAPAWILTGNNRTSSPSTSSELYSQSSSASTSSGTTADPVSLEMISQVDKVITFAQEQKRVHRYLSNNSTKSTGERGEGSSAASSDGESGLDESTSSMSEGEQDNVEEQLVAANKQVTDLKDQLERLRESRLCKICMDADLSVMLLPCTHMATCVNCTLALAICPICRTDIKHVIKPNIVA